MNKSNKNRYPPEYLFWKKRIEGQIRHTMYEHPEFFTEEAYKDNLVGRMAKRIIGEIVAGSCAGDNSKGDATTSGSLVNKDEIQRPSVSSDTVSGIRPADRI